MAETEKKETRVANRQTGASRIGVYAGSFDPVTNGHLFMIQQGARLFDELIVAIGTNPEKQYTFPLDLRLQFVRESVSGLDNVRVTEFTQRYLVHYAAEIGARFILRGIRNPHDYEYERVMRNVNQDINPEITHVFMMPPRDIAELSSSFIKGLVGPEGWKEVVRAYMPPPIVEEFIAFFDFNRKLQNGDSLTGKQPED